MMEFAFRSRGTTKLAADGDKKHWYKKAVVPLIGEELAYRKKQMFTVPVGEWFRRESYPWLAGLLRGSDLLAGLFRPERIDALLEAHRDGRANHTRELRALAALALWADQAQA
jgi:asparagine synthase (glutamine-hydrolysing)